MFGFFFGVITTLGAVAFARRRWALHQPGGRRRRMMRWLFRRLDTSYGQEKVLLGASEEIERAAAELRAQLRASVEGLGGTLRGDEFDAERLADAWVRQDEAIAKLRLALSNALQQAHETLEPGQRQLVADLVQAAPRWHGRGGWHGRHLGAFHGPRALA